MLSYRNLHPSIEDLIDRVNSCTIKAAQADKDIPLIVLTQKELSEKEAGDLNGRIKGILNKVVLNKEDLLRQLKETISRISGPP